jgi:hypothetical protein
MAPGQRYPPPPARLRGSISRGGKSALLPDIEVEDFGPPSWRTPLNSRADLGTYRNQELGRTAHVQGIPTFTLPDLDLTNPRMF